MISETQEVKDDTVELLAAYQEMIKVHGWAGTAGTLGMTKSALEARVYEVKGSGMRVDTALLIQRYAGTSHFAQAVAHASGGIFYELPKAGDLSEEEIHDKLIGLSIELGELSAAYLAAKRDGRIDRRESIELQKIVNRMHATLCQINALQILEYSPMPFVPRGTQEVANV